LRFANLSFISRDLGFEIVDIYVGAERKRYVVHKKLLVDQSEYFHKALTGSFMEAEENSIHLKEEDPTAVALLIGWYVLQGTSSIFFEANSSESSQRPEQILGNL
jgi:hypothetical protein